MSKYKPPSKEQQRRQNRNYNKFANRIYQEKRFKNLKKERRK